MTKKIAKKATKKKTVVKKTPKVVKERKVAKVKTEELEKPKKEVIKYFEAVGRRKTSVARTRLFISGEKDFLINNKPLNVYFSTFELQTVAKSALEKTDCLDKFRITVKVSGGGIHSQSEAVRHATARALVKFNPDFRKRLRGLGYLTRDPRMRERKKFGLKRARRAPQWAKR